VGWLFLRGYAFLQEVILHEMAAGLASGELRPEIWYRRPARRVDILLSRQRD